jgi:oxygen-independent coproporphyrinogen-3 oxidase
MFAFKFHPLAGLYLHIPYCHKACHYCDFHFSVNLKSISQMVVAIKKELLLKSENWHLESIETIYFGGGTPSLLNEENIEDIFETIRANYQVVENPEITFEANPEDISKKSVTRWYEIGINRLSIGIQTFDSGRLKMLNRAHSAIQAAQCVEIAQNAGFENISADLIFAVPPEDDLLLESDLFKLVELQIPHISVYGLTIEEKTVFGNWSKKGKLNPIGEENYARQFQAVHDRLTEVGFEHYEVSNFAKPMRESEHNTSYWLQKPYLGIGPGAHSYDGQTRSINIANNHQYIKVIEAGVIPETSELLTATQQLNEYILTRIRTKYGLDIGEIEIRFGVLLHSDRQKEINDLLNMGLATFEGNVLRLSFDGYLLVDEICLKLFYNE